MSLVRSNPEHEVGFLGEKRRLNGKRLSFPVPAWMLMWKSRYDSTAPFPDYYWGFGNCCCVSSDLSGLPVADRVCANSISRL